VVVTEPDWDTLVMDLPDHVALERRIRSVRTDVVIRNGRIGREPARLFREVALADIGVTPTAVYVSDYQLANEGCALEHAAEVARGAGVVSADEAATWIDELRRVAATNQFWCAVTVRNLSTRTRQWVLEISVGRRPGSGRLPMGRSARRLRLL
jgi:hypothetical protein